MHTSWQFIFSVSARCLVKVCISAVIILRVGHNDVSDVAMMYSDVAMMYSDVTMMYSDVTMMLVMSQ